jgi:hypothetical protein
MVFIILISLILGGQPTAYAAGECTGGEELIVTAPKSGAKTLNPSITVRGYLCHNHPLIMIRNETTSLEVITETSEVCDGSRCAYHFAAPVRGLEFGENRITAEIPGEEGRVEIDVIRTALAGL